MSIPLSSQGRSVDIIIVGSGVAGLSAAIAASMNNLTVLVIERGTGPPERPGETLHPGLEPLFNQFGIRQAVEKAATSRPGGICFNNDECIHRQAYGGSLSEPWLGYHILRERLHEILLQRALNLGASVHFGCAARKMCKLSSEELLIATDDGEYFCKWLFDGSGPSNWLARIDGKGYQHGSQQLTVCYGYADTIYASQQTILPWPELSLTPWGWTWDAPLGNGRSAWANMYTSQKAYLHHKPDVCKTADVTWKVSCAPAQENQFRIGDTALRLDPSSGKGVLRAMMTAIMAVHLVKLVKVSKINRRTAEDIYRGWITDWFESDAFELRQLLNRQT